MKKKLLLLVLSALMVISCVFALASCKEEPCTHAYDDDFDADCNLCGEIRVVIVSVKTIDDQWIEITYSDGSTRKEPNAKGCAHSASDKEFYRIVEPHTQTKAGLSLYRCKSCNKYSTEVESKHDSLGVRVVNKEPTCTKTGTTVSTCSICGKLNNDTKPVDALGHTYDAAKARVRQSETV